MKSTQLAVFTITMPATIVQRIDMIVNWISAVNHHEKYRTEFRRPMIRIVCFRRSSFR